MDKVRPLLLIVDDHKLLSEFLNDFYSEHFDVIVFNDGKEAQSFIRTSGSAIDAALIDLHMPLIDGDELIDEILLVSPSACIRLITGDIQNDKVKTALINFGISTIPKPFEITDLEQFQQSVFAKFLDVSGF